MSSSSQESSTGLGGLRSDARVEPSVTPFWGIPRILEVDCPTVREDNLRPGPSSLSELESPVRSVTSADTSQALRLLLSGCDLTSGWVRSMTEIGASRSSRQTLGLCG